MGSFFKIAQGALLPQGSKESSSDARVCFG